MELSLEERLFSKINYNGILMPHMTTRCHEFTGKPDNQGYARLSVDGRTPGAHRLAYQLWVGPIPPDKPQVNHHCDVRHCINPEHLYAGTKKENSQDMYSRGRENNFYSNKTHCKQGHEFNKTNICPSKDGRRRCLKCFRIRDKAYKIKHRAKILAYKKLYYIKNREAILIKDKLRYIKKKEGK